MDWLLSITWIQIFVYAVKSPTAVFPNVNAVIDDTVFSFHFIWKINLMQIQTEQFKLLYNATQIQFYSHL